MPAITPAFKVIDGFSLCASDTERLDIFFTYLREGEPELAELRLEQLVLALANSPSQAALFANSVCNEAKKIKLSPAFVQLGIFSKNGLVTEIFRRLYNKVNPPPKRCNDINDLLSYFVGGEDKAWVKTISHKCWFKLYCLLVKNASTEAIRTTGAYIKSELCYSLEMLSIWIAAEELDPELLRIDRRLSEIDSPFIALQRETSHLVAAIKANDISGQDTAHFWVMIEQCQQQVKRIRARGISQMGFSAHASHMLERLDQTLNRMVLLIQILDFRHPHQKARCVLNLWRQLLTSVTERNSVRAIYRKSTRTFAQSVTQNKSNHGEHYIAKTKKDYFKILRGACGAGVIISLLAWVKIYIESLQLAPLNNALLVSLNYGVGFMLVHILHFTIATKQPAMTAANFAAHVEKNKQGRTRSKKLARLLINVNRSQWFAVWGNITAAITVSILVSLLFSHFYHSPLLSSEQAAYQKAAIHPLSGLAWLYAGIAGVWLFLSGIITGILDNRADYIELKDRLVAHRLFRVIPSKHREKAAFYIHENYGALGGNFIFGVLLGMTSYLGYLIEVPLDIRHVAFSSAHAAYAHISDFQSWGTVLSSLFFVLMIGFINLWVSFGLALFVALRSRNCELDIKSVRTAVLTQIKQHPSSLFWPKDPVPAVKSQSASQRRTP
ncbi:hypothetical protein BZG25_00230 [Salinivibrio sp. ML198]|uniref:hypothetical protein n=1 Tax=Salinivibrio sp. ML198 TaxID=1909458 RepID=UPI000989638C|nr:hypothetical protein [Salinivibrio sp. ML198]OOE82319.1 hypothetical protein BZG25_00230 [Salinivibrio sp. ML198]